MLSCIFHEFSAQEKEDDIENLVSPLSTTKQNLRILAPSSLVFVLIAAGRGGASHELLANMLLPVKTLSFEGTLIFFRVPMNIFLFSGIIPTNNVLFVGTVPTNNVFFVETVLKNNF